MEDFIIVAILIIEGEREVGVVPHTGFLEAFAPEDNKYLYLTFSWQEVVTWPYLYAGCAEKFNAG